jgi:hypothetical protein
VAFVNRLARIVPGFGTPQSNDTNQLSAGVSLSTTGQQTNSLTAISPTMTAGYLRIKIYTGGGTSPTLIDLLVQVTDATTRPISSTT